jgi:SPP1 gp7 family putative phage head morphogenesis protein
MPTLRERIARTLGFAAAPPANGQPNNVSNMQRMLSPILYANPRIQTTSTVAINPSVLIQRKSFRIFDQIRLDEQVKAALTFKKLAVLSTGWLVESPPGQPEDWEVTQFVRDALNGMDGSFKNALRQILVAFDYGFSVTEKIYEKRDGSDKLWIKSLNTVAPHDIRFQTNEFGTLLGIQQTGNKDPVANGSQGVAPKTMPLEKFLVFSWDQEFGNWYGRSDLEAAHRAWLMKDQSYIWMGMMLERFGVPPILIHYDSVALPVESQTKLAAAFRAFQSGLAALLPRSDKADSLKVETVEMAGQVSTVFVPSINMNDQHIAKAILLPGLLGLTADATEGSLARSGTHFNVFLMVCEFARELLAEVVIQEQLIRQLVDLNFVVKDEDYPQFKLLPISDDLHADMLLAWGTLTGQKVVISTPADENHIRKQMKFPDIDIAQGSLPDDGVNPNEPPAPVAPPQLGPDGKPVVPPEPPVDKNEPPEPKVAEPKEPDAPPAKKKFSFEPPRALTEAEKKVDFAQIQSDFDTIAQDYIDRIRNDLIKIEAALLSDTRRNFQPTLEYAQSLQKLPATDDFHASVAAFMKDAFTRGRESLRREVPQIKAHAADPSLPNADLDSALAYLRTKAVTVSGVTEQKILDEVKQTLLTGVSKGSDLATITDELRAVFEPYVQQTAGDEELLNPSRLETIVRTNLTDVYNQGRLVEGAQASDFLEGWQYSAIIDGRTTDVCRLLDGVVMLPDDPNVNSLKPPRHFNCRSVLVPVVVGETINPDDLITPAVAQSADDLSGKGF